MKNFVLTEISVVNKPKNMYKFLRRLEYYNINYNNLDDKIIRESIQKRWDIRRIKRAERELKEIMEQNIDKCLTTTNTKRGRL